MEQHGLFVADWAAGPATTTHAVRALGVNGFICRDLEPLANPRELANPTD